MLLVCLFLVAILLQNRIVVAGANEQTNAKSDALQATTLLEPISGPSMADGQRDRDAGPENSVNLDDFADRKDEEGELIDRRDDSLAERSLRNKLAKEDGTITAQLERHKSRPFFNGAATSHKQTHFNADRKLFQSAEIGGRARVSEPQAVVTERPLSGPTSDGGAKLSGPVNEPPGSRQLQPAGKTDQGHKMISSALLKKLLSQTLPRAASNGTGQGQAGSHFKLVFIQRATAAPGGKKLASVKLSNETTHITEPNEATGGTNLSQTQANNNLTMQSLAASLSKQLANSLLYSVASNLMGNSLASNPSPQTLATTRQAPVSSSPSPLSVSNFSITTPTSSLPQMTKGLLVKPESVKETEISSRNQPNDIRRQSSQTTKFISIKSQGKNHSSKPKARPSRIYHLPLKFVANGQANSVVLHTIRQQFSMMKRIQQAAKGQISANDSTRNHSGSKRKNGAKLKGNSRLIYLPLKYLSNAKPGMLQVMATRASHKSTVNSRR